MTSESTDALTTLAGPTRFRCPCGAVVKPAWGPEGPQDTRILYWDHSGGGGDYHRRVVGQSPPLWHNIHNWLKDASSLLPWEEYVDE